LDELRTLGPTAEPVDSPQSPTAAGGKPVAAPDDRRDRLNRRLEVTSAGNRPENRRSLDWHRMRRRATAVILASVLVLGLAGGAPLSAGRDPALPQSPVAAGSAGASTGPVGAPPDGSPSGGPVGATEPPTESLPGTAIPSQTARTATIAFVGLILDSTADRAASVRTFTFISDGPGIVSAQIVATSPTETTRLCLAADGATPECASGATPGLTKAAPTPHSRWTVTLASADEGTPTVDVALSWPADRASIQLGGGRFQGEPNPDSLRSLAARFQPRGAGQLSLTASWPPATVAATVTLAETSAARSISVASATYPGAGSIAAYTHSVVAGRTYTLTLFDAGPNEGRPSLSATITFP
jgi:hypothetical protein